MDIVSLLKRRYLYIIFCVIAMATLEWYLWRQGIENPVYLLALLFWLCLIGYNAYGQDFMPQDIMQQFAKKNGFLYAPTGSVNDYGGSLFKIGRDKSVTNVISGTYQDLPVRIFNYFYVTGHEKFTEGHTYTVFEWRFNMKSPDILLESCKNKFGESLLKVATKKGLIKLEGDFNKYFLVSVQKGYEIEALEILAPNIMADLIRKGKGLSMEVVGESLFIYAEKVLFGEKDLRNIYGLVDYFAKKMIPVLKRMNPTL